MTSSARYLLAPVLLACAALAGPAPRASAALLCPLSLDGTLQFALADSEMAGPLLFEEYTFSGNLGDLGPVTGTADEVINGATAPLGYVTVVSSFTIVTANGDKLFGYSTGTIDLTDGTIEEVLTITGGTGAFRGAAGTATGEGSLATASETFDGTVFVLK